MHLITVTCGRQEVIYGLVTGVQPVKTRVVGCLAFMSSSSCLGGGRTRISSYHERETRHSETAM